jgi:hypothetical protein
MYPICDGIHERTITQSSDNCLDICVFEQAFESVIDTDSGLFVTTVGRVGRKPLYEVDPHIDTF